ncbi:hypothetical protein AYI70_g194 [Smittium culicis]|uniref:Uncharacterized protein n=1 Tax=Smittium culicis TaxID=133412 RepID=A0A1R1YHM2_9FUNG|nr:hypothetical protein AYI70_g194 [Smittium culicis]
MMGGKLPVSKVVTILLDPPSDVPWLDLLGANSPTIIDLNSVPSVKMVLIPDSFAMAKLRYDFPTPEGPCKRIPRGGYISSF